MNLTEEQLTASNHSNGHARVVAVAGAGKTATLIHYLGRRIEADVDPRRILVLMYNRAAKDDFDQRLSLQNFGRKPTVRTFHSLGLKLYQRLINRGVLTNTSLKPLQSNVIDLHIKQLLQSNQQASHLLRSNDALQEWVEASGSFIQLVKCHLHGPEYTFDELDYPEEQRFLIEIFNQFEVWRKENNAITYDDMLYDPALALQKDALNQCAVSDILDEVLVDEYQDINPIQHFLLKVIAGTRAKVIVIGDPDQTIYEFRGSSPLFINQVFEQDFKAPEKYSLSKTFRFGHALALAANHLITNNRNRDAILTVSAESTPNTQVHLAETDDHGYKVASAIKALQTKGAALSGMAILCRLWSFARPVELQLMAQGIPYRIEGEQSILQCWEIRPFNHLLNMLSGHFFTLSEQKKSQCLFEVLSIPSPKIPHKILHDISRSWAKNIDWKNLNRSLKKSIPSGLSSYQQKTLNILASALKLLRSSKPCSVKLDHYAKALDYQKKLLDTALNPTKGIEQGGTVNAYLQFLHTIKAKSAEDIQTFLSKMQHSEYSQAINAVTITTIHRSKGRQWPAVFIPDLTEGHLPHLGNSKDIHFDALESERRLMYVAMTRAQKKLFLTTSIPPSTRFSQKREAEDQAIQSRFIEEMQLESGSRTVKAITEGHSSVDCHYAAKDVTQRYLRALDLDIELVCEAPQDNKKPYAQQKSNNDQEDEWSVGDRVCHAKLGRGEVVKLEGEKIKICFDKGGTRTFVSRLAQPHLSFAK